MRLVRQFLPEGVTVLSVPSASTVVVDSRLTREQAALAVLGLLPHAHIDVIEHWLDQVFQPRRRMFRTLAIVAVFTIALAGPMLRAQTHHAHNGHGGVVVQAAPHLRRPVVYQLVA